MEKHKRVILMMLIIPVVSSQIFPGSFELNPPALSESGSSATGNCSDVSDSGRVCNDPRSSVIFQGSLPLPGLDGDMWASELLVLNTSSSTATMTFNFSTVMNANGITTFQRVESIEVVMFNCRSRGAGVNSIQVKAGNRLVSTINLNNQSCELLVRGCDAEISSTERIITMEFAGISPRQYIAEIFFYSNMMRGCSEIGPIPESVVASLATELGGTTDQSTSTESSSSGSTNIVRSSIATPDATNSSASVTTSTITHMVIRDSSSQTAIIISVIVIVIAIVAICVTVAILFLLIWRKKKIGKNIIVEPTFNNSSAAPNELVEYSTIDSENKLSTLPKSNESGDTKGLIESKNPNKDSETFSYSRLNRGNKEGPGNNAGPVSDVYAAINKPEPSKNSGLSNSSTTDKPNNIYSPLQGYSVSRNRAIEPKEEAPPAIPDKSKDLEVYLDSKSATLKAAANKPAEPDDIYTVPDSTTKVSTLSRNAISAKSYSDNPMYADTAQSYSDNPMYASVDGMDAVYSEPQLQPTASNFTENSKWENIYESIYSESIQPSSFMKSEESPIPDDLCPYSSIYTVPVIPTSPEKPLQVSPSNIQQEKKLGSGQFGMVILARTVGLSHADLRIGPSVDRSTSVHVAIKTLRSDANEVTKMQFEKEYRFMFRLNHPNVIRMLGICMEGTPFIMMEYMENGDLNQFLKEQYTTIVEDDTSLNSGEIHQRVLIHICSQIASGMSYLSSNNFVHRDIATRNCLVGDSFAIKIADFGMSRSLYESHYYIIKGHAILPIRWMASECFYGKFSAKTDVWAFGCTMWEVFLLSKYEPYFEMTDQELVQNAILGAGRTLLSCPKHCPRAIYDIMRSCWAHDASERPTFEQLHSKLAAL